MKTLLLTAALTLSLQAVTPDGKKKLKSIPDLVVDRHDMGWVSRAQPWPHKGQALPSIPHSIVLPNDEMNP